MAGASEAGARGLGQVPEAMWAARMQFGWRSRFWRPYRSASWCVDHHGGQRSGHRASPPGIELAREQVCLSMGMRPGDRHARVLARCRRRRMAACRTIRAQRLLSRIGPLTRPAMARPTADGRGWEAEAYVCYEGGSQDSRSECGRWRLRSHRSAACGCSLSVVDLMAAAFGEPAIGRLGYALLPGGLQAGSR
jgi:hypothetical protein